MTEVKIIYDPFKKKTTLIYAGHKINSPDNKIQSYLTSYGFNEILMPFKKHYSVWNGLLPELIYEINDDALNIVFEGRHSDHELVEKAFNKCRDIITDSGYSNSWSLSYKADFEEDNLIDRIINSADELKNLCETRAELDEINKFKASIHDEQVHTACGKLKRIVETHIKKWNKSYEPYKDSKITELKIILDDIDEVSEMKKV